MPRRLCLLSDDDCRPVAGRLRNVKEHESAVATEELLAELFASSKGDVGARLAVGTDAAQARGVAVLTRNDVGDPTNGVDQLASVILQHVDSVVLLAEGAHPDVLAIVVDPSVVHADVMVGFLHCLLPEVGAPLRLREGLDELRFGVKAAQVVHLELDFVNLGVSLVERTLTGEEQKYVENVALAGVILANLEAVDTALTIDMADGRALVILNYTDFNARRRVVDGIDLAPVQAIVQQHRQAVVVELPHREKAEAGVVASDGVHYPAESGHQRVHRKDRGALLLIDDLNASAPHRRRVVAGVKEERIALGHHQPLGTTFVSRRDRVHGARPWRRCNRLHVGRHVAAREPEVVELEDLVSQATSDENTRQHVVGFALCRAKKRAVEENAKVILHKRVRLYVPNEGVVRAIPCRQLELGALELHRSASTLGVEAVRWLADIEARWARER
mmetsp:Transcript_38683/g.111047  ORF Transcript_38683/g.111047 Transcript_38683/m.111047 type:complete len:447 (+) Transcript_38683:99-1439(+)|eukprot:CAMPEP_0177368206 /NCGR_PEP_ID=MMETSP0368-20130122/40784_1 /TAXON_ID=447022 ORGANISM="Scrippsiella hangoei-like, Strain SHHI-4" /NCGR_SAMPLE_ID=MMETSP0368 /ASSEMBLY_ACC=CAM_ASM_000363 /LENGTH=446 /DNA_ID=CAMNT_0018831287 /DNA_START=92 /DNA_END=1432 /DNA_ORIENTATION=-